MLTRLDINNWHGSGVSQAIESALSFAYHMQVKRKTVPQRPLPASFVGLRGVITRQFEEDYAKAVAHFLRDFNRNWAKGML